MDLSNIECFSIFWHILTNNHPKFYAQIVLKVFIDLKIIYNMVRSINKIVDGISYESSTAFKYKHILVLLMSWGYLSEVEHTIKAWLPTVSHRKDVCIFHNTKERNYKKMTTSKKETMKNNKKSVKWKGNAKKDGLTHHPCCIITTRTKLDMTLSTNVRMKIKFQVVFCTTSAYVALWFKWLNVTHTLSLLFLAISS